MKITIFELHAFETPFFVLTGTLENIFEELRFGGTSNKYIVMKLLKRSLSLYISAF